MTDTNPSPHAARAVRQSEKDLESSRKLIDETEELFTEIRIIYQNNHFVDKIREQIRGMA